jgi:hypothetical protein
MLPLETLLTEGVQDVVLQLTRTASWPTQEMAKAGPVRTLVKMGRKGYNGLSTSSDEPFPRLARAILDA